MKVLYFIICFVLLYQCRNAQHIKDQTIIHSVIKEDFQGIVADSLFSSVLCPSAESVFTSTAAAPEKTDTKAVDKQENRAYIDVQEILPQVSPDEAAVLRLLEDGKQPVDRLIDETQLPAGRILSALTLLEVKGYVKRLPARYYELAKK